MARLGAAIAGERAGLWAAVLLNLSPVFGVTTGTWVLPDGPLDCALLGAALCLVRALPARARTDRRAALLWWAGAGLCAGLALFAKYSAVLTLAGAFAYLLTSREHRHWLARPAAISRRPACRPGVRPGGRLERDAPLGVLRLPGRARRRRRALPSARPADRAGRRGAVRPAVDLGADAGTVRRRPAPRPGRTGAPGCWLPRRPADRAVRAGRRVVQPARAVPLGGARLPDAVPPARRGGGNPAAPPMAAPHPGRHRRHSSCWRSPSSPPRCGSTGCTR